MSDTKQVRIGTLYRIPHADDERGEALALFIDVPKTELDRLAESEALRRLRYRGYIKTRGQK